MKGSGVIAGLRYTPPVPVGPRRLLWPVKHSTSMPMAGTSMGIAPALWAESTTIMMSSFFALTARLMAAIS